MADITKIYCPENGDVVPQIMRQYCENAQITDGVVLETVEPTHPQRISISGDSKEVHRYFAEFCTKYGLS